MEGTCFFQGASSAGTFGKWHSSSLPPSPAINGACSEQQHGAARAGLPLGATGHHAWRRLVMCAHLLTKQPVPFPQPPQHLACCTAAPPHSSPQHWGSAGPCLPPGLPQNSPPAMGVPHHLTRCQGWPVLPSTARKGVPPSCWRGSAHLSPAQDIGVGEALWMLTVHPWHRHSRAFQSWGEMLKNAACITQCPVLNYNITDLKKYKNSGTFKNNFGSLPLTQLWSTRWWLQRGLLSPDWYSEQLNLLDLFLQFLKCLRKLLEVDLKILEAVSSSRCNFSAVQSGHHSNQESELLWGCGIRYHHTWAQKHDPCVAFFTGHGDSFSLW